MKQKPSRLSGKFSSHKPRITKSGHRKPKLNSIQYHQDIEINEVALEIASALTVRYIGVVGGLINPIEKGIEFKKRILSLPTYRSVAHMVSSTENLPSIHYSRLDYKNAWKIALVDFEKVKL